jgi:glucose-6-phosphate isomerase
MKQMKQQIDFGILKDELKEIYSNLDEEQIAKRLYAKDAYLWGTDIDQAEKISNRLGWLDLPTNMDELIEFTDEIRKDGFRYVVLLGMGGSSLCSEVAKETFGNAYGYPELLVLDNTAPTAILSIEEYITIEETLFIVASKSGNTMETISFFRYFYAQLEKQEFKNPGNNFVAITDEGTPLIAIAKEYKFRKVFINPTDIGGRYSVLSNFGLLPMSLMGLNINAIIESAEHMKSFCSSNTSIEYNQPIALGVALGIAQRNNIDKVTFVLSYSIQAFGVWVEQLIAESTGKHGKGLIPISGELLSSPDVYESDRVFVHMYLTDDDNESTFQKINTLKENGFPVISIELNDKLDLGAEYYRWEIATAIAGKMIGINPFDEPNVAEGKENTNDLLQEWQSAGSFNIQESSWKNDEITIFGNTNAIASSTLKEFIQSFIGQAKSNDYIALLAYLEETDIRTALLQSERMQLRDTLKIATTIGYGPRYLHSTGQLHKGGSDTGLYIIITTDDAKDIDIPGEAFSFGILHQAQSLGDFRSLTDKGRRVLYIQLSKNIDKNLEEIYNALKKV